MAGITWLHLSDWHQEGNDIRREEILKALLDDIQYRTRRITKYGEGYNHDVEQIDFIVFSGDIAFKGIKEEYDVVKKVLEKILKAAGVEKNRFFIVPGNHDFDRNVLKSMGGGIKQFESTKDIDEYLDDTVRDIALRPMNAYAQFMSDYLDEKGIDTAYAYVRNFEIKGKKIALIGLNSAWYSNRQSSDYGSLILGEHQLAKAFKKVDNDVHIKIAVLHHPIEWLMTSGEIDEQREARKRLRKECHFILHGHTHEPYVTMNIGAESEYAVLSSGAIWDRRNPDFDYPYGYNFVHIDFTEKQGIAYFRRYEKKISSFEEDIGFLGQHSFNMRKTPGYRIFPLPKNLGKRNSGLVRQDFFKWKFPFNSETFVDRNDQKNLFYKILKKTECEQHLEVIGIAGIGKSEFLKWICYHDSSEREYLAAYVDFRYLCPFKEGISTILDIIVEHLYISDIFPPTLFSEFQKTLALYRKSNTKEPLYELNEQFNKIIKSLIVSNKLVFCLDSTEVIPLNIFKSFEEHILTPLSEDGNNKNFMLVIAGRAKINWNNADIQKKIFLLSDDMSRLDEQEVEKQLIALSKNRGFGFDDSNRIAHELYHLTSGHALSNSILIHYWTDGFQCPLHCNSINPYQSIEKLYNILIQEKFLKEIKLDDQYPNAEEVLKYLAVLRNVTPPKISSMFPTFFHEKCQEQERDLGYFHNLLNHFTKGIFPIFIGTNFHPILRRVILLNMRFNNRVCFCTILNKVAECYDDEIRKRNYSSSRMIVDYIIERLYHYGLYIHQNQPLMVKSLLLEELRKYLQPNIFDNVEGDVFDYFIQKIDCLEIKKVGTDDPLFFEVDIDGSKQLVRNFQHRFTTCQHIM